MKQRLTYAQFQARKLTLASLIERYIGAMLTVKPVGKSAWYSMKAMQRTQFGAITATELNKGHVIAYAQERRKTVSAASVGHDIQHISTVLKYAGSEPTWTDCADVSDAAVAAAKPFMQKHGLIGKSTPRERRPTDDEFALLEAVFRKQAEGRWSKIPMHIVHRWQRLSGRRIGETCALLWEDWKRDDQTILVRKMKDPRGKKSKWVALPKEAQAMLIELEAVRDPNEPRIFPYSSKTCTQRYIRAKKAVGIEGLRLHDSRRDCGTNLVERDGYTPAQAIMVTGHETVHIFERTYLKQNPALFKNGPRNEQPGR